MAEEVIDRAPTRVYAHIVFYGRGRRVEARNHFIGKCMRSQKLMNNNK